MTYQTKPSHGLCVWAVLVLFDLCAFHSGFSNTYMLSLFAHHCL